MGGTWLVGYNLPNLAPRGSNIRKAGHALTVAEISAAPKLHFFPIVKDLQPGLGCPVTGCIFQPSLQHGGHVTKLSMCEQ